MSVLAQGLALTEAIAYDRKQHRLEEVERLRKREFAFRSEIPDLFDLRMEGESTMGGRPVWVISGAPRFSRNRPAPRNDSTSWY